MPSMALIPLTATAWADSRSQRRLLRASLFILSHQCSQAQPERCSGPLHSTGTAPRAFPRRGEPWSAGSHRTGAMAREPRHCPPAQPSAVAPASPTHPSVPARLAPSRKADKLNVFPMIFQGDEAVLMFVCLFLWP